MTKKSFYFLKLHSISYDSQKFVTKIAVITTKILLIMFFPMPTMLYELLIKTTLIKYLNICCSCCDMLQVLILSKKYVCDKNDESGVIIPSMKSLQKFSL